MPMFYEVTGRSECRRGVPKRLRVRKTRPVFFLFGDAEVAKQEENRAEPISRITCPGHIWVYVYAQSFAARAAKLCAYTYTQIWPDKLPPEYKVRKSNFRALETNFNVRKSNFRVLKTNFNVRKSNFRVLKTNFNVRKSNFNVRKTNFRVRKSNFRVRKSNFRVRKSNFRVRKVISGCGKLISGCGKVISGCGK